MCASRFWSNSNPDQSYVWRFGGSRRPSRLVVICVGTLFGLGMVHLLWQFTYRYEATSDPHTSVETKAGSNKWWFQSNKPLPPLYETYHELEKNMPQHNPSLPAPEGRHGRYLNTANHAALSGWGNVVQELIMNAHLAYLTKRTWVFDNYTWDRGPDDYSRFGDNIIPSRIPLTAMLSGPMVGNPWKDPHGNVMPRAVTPHFFRQVCSKEETVVIPGAEIAAITVGKNGVDLLRDYMARVNAVDARCLEIGGEVQVFDGWLFGSSNVHSLWSEMSQSPILKQFAFSPLIIGAYLTNQLHFVSPANWPDPHPNSLSEMIPGLMVLHIRRGDYEGHCHHLATYRSQYMGWNSFPEFPDHLEDQSGNLPGEVDEPEWRFEHVYQKHCYPSITQIVSRVNEVRAAHLSRVGGELGKLTRLYIMSNGKREWLKDLKAALEASSVGDWEGISTSRDLVLTVEQKYVAQQVDMYVGARASVFIGVGFSSMTSGITTLRKINDFDPMTTRFW